MSADPETNFRQDAPAHHDAIDGAGADAGTAGRSGVNFPPGTFTPAPGRGRALRMLGQQTRIEALLILRHSEQALLTLIIPLVMLVGLSLLDLGALPEPRVDSVAPRVLALAVMSTAFTGQAISLGFDRRYGVLKRLAATALPRWALITGRVLATLLVVALQAVVLGGVALLLGWSPQPAGLLPAGCALILGTLSFGTLGALIGGALRAEIVLGLANAIWLVLVFAGGLALPAAQLPGPLGDLVSYLPSGALAETLDTTLTQGTLPGVGPLLVLLCWGVCSGALAARTTRLT